jgi:hypothetical protein
MIMKMQRMAAISALVFFVGAGLFASLNVKNREQGIVANRAQLQSECVEKCTPRSASLVDVRQFPTRPATVRGNHIVEVKCECN